MDYKFPFSSIGHRLEDEIFDLLKESNSEMSTYTQGKYLSKFQSDFQDQFDLPNCLAVSNAVSALELIAVDLQIDPGDEIICPAHTYCASAYPFLKTGAKIVWADIDPKTWVAGPNEYLNCITNKTKAIIVVHLYGVPSDVYTIYDILREKGILVIEDCAQAIGATYDDLSVGTFSDYSVFSFQSHKNISTLGEGGILSTKFTDSYHRISQQLHNGHSSYKIFPSEYWKPAMSDVRKVYSNNYPSNFCMNEFQSITGSFLIKKVKDIIIKRKIKWDLAKSIIKNSKILTMQEIPIKCKSSYHLLPIKIDIDIKYIDEVFLKMAEKGIQCAKQYQPLYRYNLFDKDHTEDPHHKKLLIHTDNFYDHMISLPFHESLSLNDIKYIIDSLINISNEYL